MDDEAPPMDFTSAIKKSLTDSVKNMDVVSMLQKIVAVSPEDEESEEIREKLLGVLDQYNRMTETEQEQFSNQMKEMLASRISTKLEGHEFNLDGLQEKIGEAVMYQLAVVGVGVLLLVVLVVFFGYKLYKSIKDKEVKREEKKKAKQMKKKK